MKNLSILGLLLVSLSLLFSSCGDKPEACFEYELIDQYNYTYKFNNCSEYAITFAWDFGDGTTSTELNPEHTFEKPGTYQVKLLAGEDKKAIEMLKTIEVKKPVYITSTLSKYDAKYLEKIAITASGYAANKISEISIIHKYNGTKNILLDTILELKPTIEELNLSYSMPYVYRDSSYFVFNITDDYNQKAKFKSAVASQNTVDSTAGQVLSQAKDDKFKFDFKYSHAIGVYNKKKEKIELKLFDADGDYIHFKNIDSKSFFDRNFYCEIYDAKNKVSHIKQTSRAAATDFVELTSFDKNSLKISIDCEVDVNLDTPFYDVFQIVVQEVLLSEIINK